MAKYVRYEYRGAIRYGELKGSEIHPLEGEFAAWRRTQDAPVALDAVKLLAPTTPSKIIAVGPNFKIHFKNAKLPERPDFWARPPSTVNNPEGIVELPSRGHPGMNPEVELAIVMGKRARRVKEADAHNYIFGYTCMNDLTVGDFSTPTSFVSSPYHVYGKIFDTSAPLGPCIATDVDPHNLYLKCRVNGETRMDHTSADHIFKPALLVEMISDILTLLPGDVISTGAPPGLKPLNDGDEIEIEIENIGTLRNYVRRTD
jgi:2-keto-4-pentenoate hydratase/2-oxohepta-3-ene-1,7-dioic acid hydratase in catechol pathway